MFVFPANDSGYRLRKKAFRACVQCKQGRTRCIVDKNPNGTCLPCLKSDRACSLTSRKYYKTKSAREVYPVDASMDHQQQQQPAIRSEDISPSSSNSSPHQVILIPQGDTPGNHRTEVTTTGKSASGPSVLRENAHVDDKQVPTRYIVAEAEEEQNSKSRFVSNLDPEIQINPDTTGAGKIDRDRIGVWVKKKSVNEPTVDANHKRRNIYLPPPVSTHMINHLQGLNAFDYGVSDQDLRALVDLYFLYVHPFYPVVKESQFRQLFAANKAPTILLHAMLLAVCKHIEARNHLAGVDARTFAAATYAKITALLYASLERHERTLLQVYVLIHLHHEGSHGLEECVKNLKLAFYYMHSLNLHLSGTGEELNEFDASTYHAVMAAERISIMVKGHALSADIKDHGSVPRPSQLQYPLFNLYLEICDEAEDVLNFFRPNPTPGWVARLCPTPVDDGTPNKAFVRLLHFIMVIHYYKNTAEDGNTEQNLINAANSICDIVEEYPALPPFPVIPYALIVAISVYLRYFKNNNYHPCWKRGCKILEGLADIWWSAEALSAIATSAYEKLQSSHETEDQLYDLFTGMSGAQTFLEQTDLFAGFDKEEAEFWFPDNIVV